jgi:hypothetical protein
MSVAPSPGYRTPYRRSLLLPACALLLLLCGTVPAVQGLVTGAHWYNATGAAPFSARYGHSSVAFDGGSGDAIWVIGGYDMANLQALNDAWSSADGAAWTPVNDSCGFQARAGQSSVVFKSRMWVISGYGFDGLGNMVSLNDVWSSQDGDIWDQESGSADFSPRFGHTSASFKGDLWVIGGFDENYVPYNDTWSSPDGITWTSGNPSAEFEARTGHNTVVFKGKMWVIGGYRFDDTFTPVYYNDVWSSGDGTTWELVNASAGFAPRYGHTLLVMDDGSGERMWMIGGTDDATAFNDVWSSADGEIWTPAADPTEFPGRYSHTSVTTGSTMWVIGGTDTTGTVFNDAWYSPLPAPLDVTGITPAGGLNTGPVAIPDLSGTGFIPGATVVLARAGFADIAASGVDVLSPSHLSCSLPVTGAHWGPWNVTVTNPDGQVDTLQDGFAVTAPAPSVGSITPVKGYNTGSIFINNLAGTGFLPGATVTLVNATAGPGITATNVSVNPAGTSITCTLNLVGAAAAKRNVTVTNPDGQSGSLAGGFEIVPRFPVVTNMIPGTAENSGLVNTTILGTDFVAGAIVRLEKTGQSHIVATNVSVNSETNITCSFNLAAMADGSWTLNVINPGNQGNNIFQFVVLAAKSATGGSGSSTGSSSASGTGGGGSSGSGTTAAARSAPAPAAPVAASPAAEGVTTAGLSVTSSGVVTEPATVSSEDSLATVSIPAGIVAMDEGGSALASVSIGPLSGSEVPADSPGSAFSFTGMAYDLGPDGATFSPAITLSFAVPEGEDGGAFTIRMLDESTMSWMSLPTTYDPGSRTVTTEVSHFCCFALFANAPVTPPAAAASPRPSAPPVPAPTPPPTAMSIFSGLLVWMGSQAVRSPVVVVVVVILAIGIFWFGSRQVRIRRIMRRRKNP